MILRGRWLLRPGFPAVENAALVVRHGKISEAGRWPEIARRAADQQATDLGDVVLTPGFVNAHAHLELSDLRGRFPRPRRFTDWLRSLVGEMRRRGPEVLSEAVRSGAAESLAAGVTTVADITYRGAASAELAASPLRSTTFVEVYGHAASQVAKRLASALAAAEGLPASKRFRVGLSPHAPYSAGVKAYVAAVREADRRGWPLATHLHETREEIDLYRCGRGGLRRWLPLRLILWRGGFRPPGTSPIKALAAAGFFHRPVLVAHCNYLDDEEIEILRRSGSTVAYCPRSHDYFGHADHPYPRLLAAGLSVALGTDSLASSPSLSILDEMRFLHARDPALPPESLLAMATAAGADALGLSGCAGRLAIGEEADMVAVECASGVADPWDALLDGGSRVSGVWIAGERVSP